MIVMQLVDVTECPSFVFPGVVGGADIILFRNLDFLDSDLQTVSWSLCEAAKHSHVPCVDVLDDVGGP